MLTAGPANLDYLSPLRQHYNRDQYICKILILMLIHSIFIWIKSGGKMKYGNPAAAHVPGSG